MTREQLALLVVVKEEIDRRIKAIPPHGPRIEVPTPSVVNNLPPSEISVAPSPVPVVVNLDAAAIATAVDRVVMVLESVLVAINNLTARLASAPPVEVKPTIVPPPRPPVSFRIERDESGARRIVQE